MWQGGPRVTHGRGGRAVLRRRDLSGVRELQRTSSASWKRKVAGRRKEIRPKARLAKVQQQGRGSGCDEARRRKEAAAVFCRVQKIAAGLLEVAAAFAGSSGLREEGEDSRKGGAATSGGQRGGKSVGGVRLAAKKAGGLFGVAGGWKMEEADGSPRGGRGGRLRG